MKFDFLTVVTGTLVALFFIDIVNYFSFTFNPILGSLIFYCGFLGLIVFIIIREKGVKHGKEK